MSDEQLTILLENQMVILNSLAVLHSRREEEKDYAALMHERAKIVLLYMKKWGLRE